MTSFKDPVTFSPNLNIDDELATYWLRQVTIRLRREICWCWHERGFVPDSDSNDYTILPPYADKSSIALNLVKFYDQKKKFFETDKTARYLTEQLQTIPSSPENKNKELIQGSFSWIVNRLNLDNTSSFLLALGLIVIFDNAASSVIGACLNDPRKTYPNFALAHKIWDIPEHIINFADPQWQLFRLGLLHCYDKESIKSNYSEINWEVSIGVPALVAHYILFPNSPLPWIFNIVSGNDGIITDKTALIATRLKYKNHNTVRIIPIRGQKQSDHKGVVYGISKMANRKVVELIGDYYAVLRDIRYLNSIITLCWLKDIDLFLGLDVTSSLLANDTNDADKNLFSLSSIPINIFMSINDSNQIKYIPNDLLLPIVDVPKLSYEKRVEYWEKILGGKYKGLDKAILELSRRFRYEKKSIDSIWEGLKSMNSISYKDFVNACKAEVDIDLGDLAQKCIPRFKDERLILPPKQLLQFKEIITSMKSLTQTCYGWNMAKTENETGITVLFAGHSGTGKTMAAEILAYELELPMYKIDLSQVVNKYIGETEKHLKRLFDIADTSDIILFFDEADALFGHRTEVKDSHDRFANMEINYLLERMDSFKGLSILATNRKKDFDEAFLRRIRYILDFPFPSEQQRKAIWQQVIPSSMNSTGIDFDFLAKQFQLTGGNIRSIILNACLQSAKSSSRIEMIKDVLTMENIIIAIKREYEKSNRPIALDQFGQYSEIINSIDSI